MHNNEASRRQRSLTRVVASTAASFLVVLVSACSAFSESREDGETDERARTNVAPVAHIGESVIVRDINQDFDYQISMIGWSALGGDVPKAMSALEYGQSRALWDEGFRKASAEAGFDDLSLITFAAVGSTDASSRRTFLTRQQRGALKGLIDGVLSKRLPRDARSALRPTITSASMLAEMSHHLRYRQADTQRLIASIEGELDDTTIGCSTEAWTSPRNAIAIERLNAGLPLHCEKGELAAAWDGVVRALERTRDSGPLTSAELDLLKIAVLVTVVERERFDSEDRRRVQGLVETANARLSDDPYNWLYFYKLFADHPDSGYTVRHTDASWKVLLHFASHGGPPGLEIVR